jgi:hypothetical protein
MDTREYSCYQGYCMGRKEICMVGWLVFRERREGRAMSEISRAGGKDRIQDTFEPEMS